jgi:hypothetical protein
MDACSIPLSKGYVALVSPEDYDALSVFRWHANVRKPGSVYAQRSAGVGQRILMHHAVSGRPPQGFVVDHINGDSLDNRRANLRHATLSENVLNCRPKGGPYQYIEKLPCGRFRVQMRMRGRIQRFGVFDSIAFAEEVVAILKRMRANALHLKVEG